MSKSKRGFASMPREQRRAIAGLGGKAAHAQGMAHTWTREEAQRAGRTGGLRRISPSIPNLKAGNANPLPPIFISAKPHSSNVHSSMEQEYFTLREIAKRFRVDDTRVKPDKWKKSHEQRWIRPCLY
jgi:general stress protein YciG